MPVYWCDRHFVSIYMSNYLALSLSLSLSVYVYVCVCVCVCVRARAFVPAYFDRTNYTYSILDDKLHIAIIVTYLLADAWLLDCFIFHFNWAVENCSGLSPRVRDKEISLYHYNSQPTAQSCLWFTFCQLLYRADSAALLYMCVLHLYCLSYLLIAKTNEWMNERIYACGKWHIGLIYNTI